MAKAHFPQTSVSSVLPQCLCEQDYRVSYWTPETGIQIVVSCEKFTLKDHHTGISSEAQQSSNCLIKQKNIFPSNSKMFTQFSVLPYSNRSEATILHYSTLLKPSKAAARNTRLHKGEYRMRPCIFTS